MKNLALTTVLLISVGLVVALAAYTISGDRDVGAVLKKRDALEWLRTDFHLDDSQFAAIKRLHQSYALVCEEHCHAIQVATRELNELRGVSTTSPETLAFAEQRVKELRAVCETAIAAHVREVAAHMSPDNGRRYLALVLPKIADFDHRAAPDVGVNRRAHDH